MQIAHHIFHWGLMCRSMLSLIKGELVWEEIENKGRCSAYMLGTESPRYTLAIKRNQCLNKCIKRFVSNICSARFRLSDACRIILKVWGTIQQPVLMSYSSISSKGILESPFAVKLKYMQRAEKRRVQKYVAQSKWCSVRRAEGGSTGRSEDRKSASFGQQRFWIN